MMVEKIPSTRADTNGGAPQATSTERKAVGNVRAPRSKHVVGVEVPGSTATRKAGCQARPAAETTLTTVPENQGMETYLLR